MVRPMEELIGRLRSIVGEEWCFTQEHQLRTYESDGLLQYAVRPGVAVLPADAEQVQACVRACAEAEVAWVARGSGSGLSGGALPLADGVLIVTSRMARILEIDRVNQRVCVEPGVTNIAVSSAVAPELFYPPDPSSQIVCSIGGNVAENSGGAHCFKYGFTTNYVCGLEVVLPDGEMVMLGGQELDQPGYDLLGAFVGSEGTLGIATKVWLRVVPSPETVKTLVAFFDSTHAAGEAVSEIVQSGVVPGAIEMMDKVAIEASEAMAHAGYPVGRGAALLVELDGAERECEARFDEVLRICEALRLRRRARGARRDGARAVLEDAQGGVPRDGPHLPQLLRAGRRDPADQAPGGARRDRGARRGVRDDRRQRLPRGRRQPAPARVLRRPDRRRGRAGRGALRADHGRVPAGRRLDHRRARRRRGQEALHGEDVRRGRPRRVPAPALRVRPRRASRTPAR